MVNNNQKPTLEYSEILNYNKTNEFEEAIFGMGCFWCSEAAFYDTQTNVMLPGIISTVVGYMTKLIKGTSVDRELDEDDSIEVVKILFDPMKISYKEILNIFWHNIDPFDNKGQFCDRGNAYIASIFYKNINQLLEAKHSKEDHENLFGRKILTNIQQALPFRIADEHHQNYKENNPVKYKYYRWNCGRDRKLQEIWNGIKVQKESFLFPKNTEQSKVLEEA